MDGTILSQGSIGDSSKIRDEDRHCAAIALGIRLQSDAQGLLEKEANRRLKIPLVCSRSCSLGSSAYGSGAFRTYPAITRSIFSGVSCSSLLGRHHE